MNEILFALAVLAKIGNLIFQVWKYKQERRMMKGDEVGTGGNQSH